MFEKVGIPILGVVENMSIHICSNCGHESHIFGERRRATGCARTTATELLGSCRWTCRHPRAGRFRPADGRGRSRRRGWRRSTGDRAPVRGQDRRVAGRGHCRRSSRTSSCRTPDDDQIGQLDPPHGAERAHDRAVRAGPGQGARRTAPDRVLRHLELRLRYPLLERIQDLHQHQLDDRRPQGVRREVLRRLQRRRLHHPAQFLRARAHGRVLPHSAQRAHDLPRQDRPTHAAASSSTSRRSSRNGRGT